MAAVVPHPTLELPGGIDFAGCLLPPPITTPIPDDEAIANAVEFSANIFKAKHRARNPTSAQAIATAAVWEHKVLTAAAAPIVAPAAAPADGPPPWMQALFDEVGTRITALDESIQTVKTDIRNLDESIQTVKTDVRNLHEFTLKFYVSNSKTNNGVLNDPNYLEQVPFPDGTFPWGKVVNGPRGTNVELPPLSSVQAVGNLSRPQTYGYFKGYYPEHAGNLPGVDGRKKAILEAIGRRDA